MWAGCVADGASPPDGDAVAGGDAATWGEGGWTSDELMAGKGGLLLVITTNSRQ